MNSVGLSKFKGPRSRELLLSMNPPLSGHPAVREINAFANFQIPPAYANRIKVDACQKCQMNCARLAHQQFRSRWLRTRVFWTRVSREQNKQRRYDFAESSSDVFSNLPIFRPRPWLFRITVPNCTENTFGCMGCIFDKGAIFGRLIAIAAIVEIQQEFGNFLVPFHVTFSYLRRGNLSNTKIVSNFNRINDICNAWNFSADSRGKRHQKFQG